ncbi:MAG: hypothetical protein KU37_07275 [Sulfuricurvum sp. PC08-66]|nr:MAG: hypothetical protein KU37_07275 [Sulfuricurvum sp. PC08-66]
MQLFGAFRAILVVGILLFTMQGCASKEESINNQSASYWYDKIIRSIAISALTKADDYYSSLHSEHPSSPLLPQAMLMLATAHAQFDELILSQYYLDEYLKRFGSEGEREYVSFMRVKNAFLDYRHPNRNQKFLDETIETIESFTQTYPDSAYLPMVRHMLLRLELGRETMKEEIAALYDRIEKPQAAQFYRQKERMSMVDAHYVKPAEVFWMRALFE